MKRRKETGAPRREAHTTERRPGGAPLRADRAAHLARGAPLVREARAFPRSPAVPRPVSRRIARPDSRRSPAAPWKGRVGSGSPSRRSAFRSGSPATSIRCAPRTNRPSSPCAAAAPREDAAPGRRSPTWAASRTAIWVTPRFPVITTSCRATRPLRSRVMQPPGIEARFTRCPGCGPRVACGPPRTRRAASRRGPPRWSRDREAPRCAWSRPW